ncbi:MAG TPA: glycosyltransferase [Chthoniobacterales bacterium]|jgi:glycosyltransferase involved in cell wall biosynthesis|nr:glycosyltransferase [Chthoniobacterales bacterium]
MPPKVVLGIVTRDRAAILPKAIDSALAQNCSNCGICVLDDGSTDDTSALVRQYPQVTLISWPRSQGYVAARNYLMRNLAADYFVSLDDDARFLKGDEIAAGVNYLESRPDVAIVAFDVLSPDQRTPRRRTEPRPTPTFIGCGHIARLTAIKKIGGYATAPGGYGGEEKDLSLRLMDAGYGVMLMPGVHVWHEKTTVARDLVEQHRSGVCNDFGMTLRRTPLAVLPLALLAKLYRHFRFARTHNLERPFWDGLQLFLQSIPELWQSRKPVRFATLQKYLKLSKEQGARHGEFVLRRTGSGEARKPS